MHDLPAEWIVPEWPAPGRVRALSTTRHGGVSEGCYASLNLGDHVGDAPERVAANRRRLRSLLPCEPRWLQQVHGVQVADAAVVSGVVQADAAVARVPGVVCAIMTADCLPVILCDDAASVVAAAHAGWRGLAGGVIENTVAATERAPESLMAWLGPAIGPQTFEVGDEVRQAFTIADPEALSAFQAGTPGKWLADLFVLARLRLKRVGVTRVYGGNVCTFSDSERFFSHRRDRVSGRMATLIWLE